MRNAMKKLASAAIAIIAVVPALAMAGDSARFEVTVSGFVPGACNWVIGATEMDMTIEGFVDADARVVSTPLNVTVGTMRCTGPASVGLRTDNGGLKNIKRPGPCTSTGNSSCVNYMATAMWNGTAVTYLTNGTPLAAKSSELSVAGGSQPVSLTITPAKPANDVQLIAGDFTDLLTLQVGPPL
jgi:hypothetical protein